MPEILKPHIKRPYKRKKSFNEMIEHLKEKGLRFNQVSESDARRYLTNKNYYFKLTSYRANFKKIDGMYQNLDFDYLVDLANIDAALRRFVFSTTLNIEHGLKVLLLSHITADGSEDGYTVVDDFRSARPFAFEQTMNFLGKARYSQDLYKKHHADPAIWVLLEVMSFGGLSQFVEFYGTRKPTRQLRAIAKVFKFAKNLRNASAHSNPILINLFTQKETINRPTSQMVDFGNEMGISRDYMTDMKIHDLVALFKLVKLLTSPESVQHTVDQARLFLDRMDKHAEYYDDVASIQQFKMVFSKMVAFLES
jgi:abortive infection bacteriophage resistance protein